MTIELDSLSAKTNALQNEQRRVLVHVLGLEAEAMSSAQSTEAPAAENLDSEVQAVDNPANT